MAGTESEEGELVTAATNEVRILVRGDAQVIVTKRYRERRHYRQERDALLSWAPRLPFAAPRLLEDRGEEEKTLVLRGLAGDVPDESALSSPDLHRSAGAVLALLHALDHDDRDRLAPRIALRIRLESLLVEGGDRLEAEYRERALSCLEVIEDTDWPIRRVPCHRDFEPRNWLLGPAGFGLIDFEHARPDLAEVDLVKLDLGLHRDRPDLAAAFYEGYGGQDDPGRRSRLDVLGFIHALGTLLWGRSHGDRSFSELGRRQLAALPHHFEG